MSKNRLLLGIVAGTLLVSLLIVFSGKSQSNRQTPAPDQVPFGQAAKQIDDAATPIVDFDQPSADHSFENGSRTRKNARYDKSGAVRSQPHSNAGEVVVEPEWRSGQGPSDFPADKSAVVVEAIVADSKAFLSNDKTGVYSEFTIVASRILRVAPGLSFNLGDAIVIERFGAKIRYASGQVIRIRIAGQGTPIVGKTYLFFLSKIDQDSYGLLTAYQIHDGKVFALDGSRTNFGGQGSSVFDKHNGEDLAGFREKVERALKNSQGGVIDHDESASHRTTATLHLSHTMAQLHKQFRG
ncbi:MAG TPA: hypothetical protein VJT71_14310 [Pyrinomonadaceae bacterium]|nr:hypothetical protein [Pyrinomonadaceae bacterium]